MLLLMVAWFSQRGYSDEACWWLHDLVNVVTVMLLLMVTWFSQRGYTDAPVDGNMI